MKMIYLICLTVELHSALVDGRSAKNSSMSEFEAKVLSTMRDLGNHYDGIRDCYDAGLTKAQSVGRLRSRDELFAVILINMYSSETCRLFRNRNELFYVKLNQKLRSNTPGDPESILWEGVGDIVNEAIGILGRKTFRAVYRGVTYTPENLQPHSFRAITSTSTNPKIAEGFSDGVTFIQIEDARGLEMEKYSDFPMEKEVLLRSTDIYSIEKYTQNETLIRKALDKIAPGLRQVKLFVRLRQKRSKNFISRLFSNALKRLN